MNEKSRPQALPVDSLSPAEGARSPGLHAGVSTVMTREVASVREDWPLATARKWLAEHGLSSAPVVGSRGKLIGIVSRSDLQEGEATAGGGTVQEVMVRTVVTLPESATLVQAAAVMAFEGLHRIPILSGDGSVAGLLSAIDIMRHLARAEGYLVPAYTQRHRARVARGSRC